MAHAQKQEVDQVFELVIELSIDFVLGHGDACVWAHAFVYQVVPEVVPVQVLKCEGE